MKLSTRLLGKSYRFRSVKELLARAEAWRPWRAYATHYLWRTLGVHP